MRLFNLPIILFFFIIFISCKEETSRPENNFIFEEINYNTSNVFYWNNSFGIYYVVLSDGVFDTTTSVLEDYTNLVFFQFYSGSTIQLARGIYPFMKLENEPTPNIIFSGEIVLVDKGTYTVSEGMVKIDMINGEKIL